MTSQVKNRTNKARELRRNQTPAEEIIWNSIRNRKLMGFKFRRQHVINDYIVDFFCKERLLVIEIDGPYHSDYFQKNYDEKRELELIENGYSVLRFNNDEVLENLKEVLAQIESFIIR